MEYGVMEGLGKEDKGLRVWIECSVVRDDDDEK